MSEKNEINEKLIVKLEEKIEILETMVDILQNRIKFLEIELLYAKKMDEDAWRNIKTKLDKVDSRKVNLKK